VTSALMTAHQGGWDELLLVAVPVVLFALLLRMANRRAGRLQDSARLRDAIGAPEEADRASDPPS
jgi:hypothetical protein